MTDQRIGLFNCSPSFTVTYSSAKILIIMSSYINCPIHTYSIKDKGMFILYDSPLWFHNAIHCCLCSWCPFNWWNTNLKCGELCLYAIVVIGYTKQTKVRWMLEKKKRKKASPMWDLTTTNMHRCFLSIGSQINEI